MSAGGDGGANSAGRSCAWHPAAASATGPSTQAWTPGRRLHARRPARQRADRGQSAHGGRPQEPSGAEAAANSAARPRPAGL